MPLNWVNSSMQPEDVTAWAVKSGAVLATNMLIMILQCLLTRIANALEAGSFDQASELQIEMEEKMKDLINMYSIYKKNLF